MAAFIANKFLFRCPNLLSEQQCESALEKELRRGDEERMGCKAGGEDESAATLVVVSISSSRPTKQTAF